MYEWGIHLNIYDIAQKAEVSIATVSRVLNGKDTVSEKTRKRVLDVMEEMGYTPNIFARGLGLNTIKMIGVMCNDVTDLYCSAALSVIEKEVRRNGYDVILCCTGDDLAVKKQYLSLLLSKRVDSLILIGSIFKSREDNSHIYEAAEKVPVVIINGYVEAPNIYCVLCDNYNATREAVLRLAEKGHTRIAHMYRAQTYSGLEKINGYRDGLEEAGLSFDPALLVKVGGSLELSQQMTKELIRNQGVTAVISSCNVVAAGAMKGAMELKKRIPQDFAVVGYDDTILVRCTTPELSYIDSRVEELGTLAVRTAIEVLEGKKVPPKAILPGIFVEKETV